MTTPNFNSVFPIRLSDVKVAVNTLNTSNLDTDLILAGVSEKSYLVEKDFVFFALPGTALHGANFVSEAISRGAILVVTDLRGEKIIRRSSMRIPIQVYQEPRKILARFASAFFKDQPPSIIGVTGTNGKSSVTHYVRQIWEYLGKTAASVGTTGVQGAINFSLEHTTPDAIKLHWLLNQMENQGVTHVAIEASSHGLAQRRLDGINFMVGAFTNLSRDHFDYHKNIEAYFKAKTILFEGLNNMNGSAVICIDDEFGSKLFDIAKRNSYKTLSVGKSEQADIRILSQNFHDRGQKLKFSWKDREHVVSLPLFGNFQAQNVMLTLGILDRCGEKSSEVIDILRKLKAVPGRMEEVAIRKNGARVFVDYAHTPDALEAVLRSIRLHFMGKLHLVFGVGGDRDKGKRSLMGKIASQLSDRVIITDDNPRSENPSYIRAEIKKFCPKAIEISDRAEAILAGVDALESEDALVIAGKGHERTQIYADSIFPFDDAEQANLSVQLLDGKFP